MRITNILRVSVAAALFSSCATPKIAYFQDIQPGTAEEVSISSQVAIHYLNIMSICLSILYMLHIYRSALMGLGDTIMPMASGIMEFLMRIGVALFLPLIIGQEGIFYAEVTAWTGAAILLVTTYFVRMHKLTRGLDTSQSKAGE